MISSPLLRNIGGYIDGKWITPQGDRKTAVINPATGEYLADVPIMDARQTTEAVESAARALEEPASITERAGWLASIADVLVNNKDELGRILTMEQGKPLK